MVSQQTNRQTTRMEVNFCIMRARAMRSHQTSILVAPSNLSLFFRSFTIWVYGMAWGLRWVVGWAAVASWLAFVNFFSPICDLGGLWWLWWLGLWWLVGCWFVFVFVFFSIKVNPSTWNFFSWKCLHVKYFTFENILRWNKQRERKTLLSFYQNRESSLSPKECERPRPGPFYEMLGQAHVNGWSRIIASQNGGSTSYIFSL